MKWLSQIPKPVWKICLVQLDDAVGAFNSSLEGKINTVKEVTFHLVSHAKLLYDFRRPV